MGKLIFIGTGAAGYIGSKRQLASAYFDGLLLDCGGSVTGRLEDSKVVDDIKAVLISHIHSDHYSGLFDLIVHIDIKCIIKERLAGKKEKRKLLVYSPPGLKPIIKAMAETGKVYEVFFDYVDVVFVDVADGMEFEISGKQIKAVLMDHKKTEDFGYLIRTKDFNLFYTGDTREPSALEKLKVDYLIHEATFSEKNREAAEVTGHSTGRQAAEAAMKVGAKRLFLTHVGNSLENEAAIEKEAKAFFKETVLPDDMDAFSLK